MGSSKTSRTLTGSMAVREGMNAEALKLSLGGFDGSGLYAVSIRYTGLNEQGVEVLHTNNAMAFLTPMDKRGHVQSETVSYDGNGHALELIDLLDPSDLRGLERNGESVTAQLIILDESGRALTEEQLAEYSGKLTYIVRTPKELGSAEQHPGLRSHSRIR